MQPKTDRSPANPFRDQRVLERLSSAMCVGSALILAAGLAAGVAADTGAQSIGVEALAAPSSLDAAERALASGRVLVARDRLLASPGAGSERGNALRLRIERDVRGLSPTNLTLERADSDIVSNDLRAADRLVRRLSNRRADLTQGQLDRLEGLESELAFAVDAAKPDADALARLALKVSQADRLAEAKALVAEADRLGPALNETARARLDIVRGRILDAELALGETIEQTTLSAAVMTPGSRQPSEKPAEQPSGEPDAAPATPEDIVERSQRAAADTRLSEAQAQWAAGSRRQAAATYRELLDVYGDFLTPEQTRLARQRVSQVDSLLGGQPTDLGEDFVQSRELQRQAAERLFAAEMATARRNLDSGATEEARINASQARLVVNQNRGVLSDEVYRSRIALVDDLLQEINEAEQDLRARAIERRNEQIRRDAEISRARATADREKRIVEALTRARDLQEELKYKEAREVVDQAIFLDPTNPAALLIRDVLDELLIFEEYNALSTRKGRAFSKISIENLKASIPPVDIVEYPPDWPTLSYKRSQLAELALSGEDQRVLARLERDRISPEFQNDRLEDAIEFVRTVAKVNVDVNWRSLEEVGVTRDTPVSLRLDGVRPKLVLERVLRKVSDPVAPAGWSVKDGIVTIASRSMLDRDVKTMVYDVRDLLVEVPDYDELPAFNLTDVISRASADGLSLSVDPLSEEGRGAGDREQGPDRVAEIMSVIRQNVAFDSWQANGGSIGTIQDLNGSLIVTTTPENQRQVSGLLSRLREFRALQINVEARFLTINQAFFEQLGFDVDVVFNAENNQVQTIQGTSVSAVGSDFVQLTSADGVAINNSTGTQVTSIGGTAVPPPNGGFSPVEVGSNTLGLSESLLLGLVPGESFTGSVLNAGPALGVAGRFLDDVQVDFLVKATQADQRSSQLTAPRITFSNGQTANINVATQRAFVSGLNPAVGTAAVAFTPQVGVLTEGTILGVEGTVSADRRYVTLSITTGTNIFDGFATSSVSAAAGGAGGAVAGGGAGGTVIVSPASAEFQLPTVTVTQVQTTVTVPDQGTVLLGGQRVVTEVEVESGVPVLSKIPLINRFFTNRLDTTEESTLIILVKPTILIQNEQEENNFPGLLDSLNTSFGG